MFMSFKSVFVLQQIINFIRCYFQRVDFNGYMMMFFSGGCFFDIGGGFSSSSSSIVFFGSSYGKLWINGVGGYYFQVLFYFKFLVESSGGKFLFCIGDYMNMLLVGDFNISSFFDCYYGFEDFQYKLVFLYYLLLRFFKYIQCFGELEEGVWYQYFCFFVSFGCFFYVVIVDDFFFFISSDSWVGDIVGLGWSLVFYIFIIRFCSFICFERWIQLFRLIVVWFGL